jgi:hypothetical protein
VKRTPILVAAGLAALSLGACSPEWFIQDVFGAADAPAAISVATCESSLNPEAVSPGGGNHGLFQINNVHQGEFEAVTGRPWSDVYNPKWNAYYAKHLFDSQGWGPWACKP